MEFRNETGEFPELREENHRIWNANAAWWDDKIGEGNDFQDLLIEPAAERLLAIQAGDTILDIACGAGRFTRRMAQLGAHVVALDQSESFIERARSKTDGGASIDYRCLDATGPELLSLGIGRFDKAVCTMALMDMPEIAPLLSALPRLLKAAGVFVFSVIHPCFHSASIERFAEIREDEPGRHTTHSGVKVSAYRTPFARKTEGIVGQPEPQYIFHRPLQSLLRGCFEAGFVLDGFEEPGFATPDTPKPGVRWSDMPEIPPIAVFRVRGSAWHRTIQGRDEAKLLSVRP